MSDPNPKDAAGKVKTPFRYVPPALEIWVAEVNEHGAIDNEYGLLNWRDSAVNLMVYVEAAKRHLAAIQDGQDLDPKSGLPHAAHVAAGMGIILDAFELGKLIDDRGTPGPAADLLAKRAAARLERRTRASPVPPGLTVVEPSDGTCCENGRFGDGHECMKQPGSLSTTPWRERMANPITIPLSLALALEDFCCSKGEDENAQQLNTAIVDAGFDHPFRK